MFAKDTRYLFQGGIPSQTLSTPYFLFKYQKNLDQKNHYAIVVSKKVDKRSVVRNSLKRKMSHILRELLKETKEFYDLVFFTRPCIVSLSNEQLKQEIARALERVNIL